LARTLYALPPFVSWDDWLRSRSHESGLFPLVKANYDIEKRP
jgi:hypothetical protein